MSDTLSNADLKKRFPSMEKMLTISYPGVPHDDRMLEAFTRAADGILDVKTANKFLARFMEEAQALKGAK